MYIETVMMERERARRSFVLPTTSDRFTTVTPVAGNAVPPQSDTLTPCNAPINRITKLPGSSDAPPSVSNTRKTPVTRGLGAALHQKTHDEPPRPRRLEGDGDACLIQIARNGPQEGYRLHPAGYYARSRACAYDTGCVSVSSTSVAMTFRFATAPASASYRHTPMGRVDGRYQERGCRPPAWSSASGRRCRRISPTEVRVRATVTHGR